MTAPERSEKAINAIEMRVLKTMASKKSLPEPNDSLGSARKVTKPKPAERSATTQAIARMDLRETIKKLLKNFLVARFLLLILVLFIILSSFQIIIVLLIIPHTNQIFKFGAKQKNSIKKKHNPNSLAFMFLFRN